MATLNLNPVQRQFLQARDVSAPLVVVRTPDQIEAVKTLGPVVLTPDQRPAPAVQWDCAAGVQAVNAQGQKVAQLLGGEALKNPVQALLKAASVDERTALFMMNLQDFWDKDPMVRQAMWNLREPFKRNGRTLVALQHEGGVPAAMEHDVLMIDDPLPDPARLLEIVKVGYKSAKLELPKDEAILHRAVDAVAGLSAFAAEQAVVLSLQKSGINLDTLRERHRQMITNTKGLSVWRGTESLTDVGGLEAAKTFLRRFRAAGMYRFGSVFWIDELEKALAGVKGDLTGITQDYLSVLLQYMQDNSVPGILLMGHPGTGKSYLAKAFGAMSEVPVIRADLGAMHGSLVGQSQHALRHAIRVQHAVSQGRPLFVATCNNVAVLPPELTNRFVWRFFVDLPDRTEKDAIWPIQLKRYGLDLKQRRPTDTDWNGREIDQCCATAMQLKCPVLEAAEMIVPIAQSSAEEIERRRREANGRYLSASYPGAYVGEARAVVVGGRQVKLSEEEPVWNAPGSSKPN